jgi:hypothetical protein
LYLLFPSTFYPSSSFFVSCLPFTALPFLSLFFCWLFMIVRILGFIGYLTHLFSLFPLLWLTIIVKILKFMFFFFQVGDGLTEVYIWNSWAERWRRGWKGKRFWQIHIYVVVFFFTNFVFRQGLSFEGNSWKYGFIRNY